MYTTVELAPRFRGKEVHQDSEKAAKNATEAVMKRISAEDPNRKSLSNCKSKKRLALSKRRKLSERRLFCTKFENR